PIPVSSEFVNRPAEAGPPPPRATPLQARTTAFALGSVAIVVLRLQHMQPVLLPLVLGAMLFYALDPGVDRLQKLHVPRALGAALMLFVVVTGWGVLGSPLQGRGVTWL